METRGRPRNEIFVILFQSVCDWHQANVKSDKPPKESTVKLGPLEDAKRTADSFRNSTTYRELKEVYGNVFKVMVSGKYIHIGYKEEK